MLGLLRRKDVGMLHLVSRMREGSSSSRVTGGGGPDDDRKLPYDLETYDREGGQDFATKTSPGSARHRKDLPSLFPLLCNHRLESGYYRNVSR